MQRQKALLAILMALDLNKDKQVALSGYDIELAPACPHIAIDNLITVPLQIAACPLFSLSPLRCTQSASLFYRLSLTPLVTGPPYHA